MEDAIIKVWVSKYSLTQGIYEAIVGKCENTNTDMVKTIGRSTQTYHGEGVEWHLTKEEAILRAEEIKIKRIANLEKQIIKLGKLKF